MRRDDTTTLRSMLSLLVVLSGSGCDILTALRGGEGLACDRDRACANGLICVDRRCQRPGTCISDGDCAAGLGCRNSACVAVPGNDAGVDAGRDAALDATSDSAFDAHRDAAGPDHGGSPDVIGGDVVTLDRAFDAGRDAALAGDAGSDGGVLPCGTVSLIQDDFDDPVRSPQWLTDSASPITAAERLGVLLFTVPPAVLSATQGYFAPRAASLRNDRLTIEVSETTSLQPGVAGVLQFGYDGDNYLQVVLANGRLVLEASTTTEHHSATDLGPWVEQDDRWWQLREHGGLLFVETSPDGVNYTWRHTRVAPWFIDLGRVWIGAFAARTEAGSFESLFAVANVNRDPQPRQTPGWCPAATLQDDFSTVRPEWEVSGSPGCAVSWSGGMVSASMAVEPLAWCGLITRAAYSLDASAVQASFGQCPSTGGVWTMIHVIQPDQNLQYGYRNGTLFALIAGPSGETLWQRERSATGCARQLKVNHQRSGTLEFWSKDSVSTPWQDEFATATSLHFDQAVLGVLMWSPVDGPGRASATFDHYNVP